MTAAFTALTHAAHRAATFATHPAPGAGVMTETASAFVVAEMTAPAAFASTAALTFTASFAVFVKSKHDVFLRFHVAKIYL